MLHSGYQTQLFLSVLYAEIYQKIKKFQKRRKNNPFEKSVCAVPFLGFNLPYYGLVINLGFVPTRTRGTSMLSYFKDNKSLFAKGRNFISICNMKPCFVKYSLNNTIKEVLKLISFMTCSYLLATKLIGIPTSLSDLF